MLFAHGRRKLPQRFLLVVVEVLRDGDIHRDELVTSSAAAQIRDSLAAQAEHCPRLGSFRNGQLDLSIQGWNLDFGAKNSLREADVLLHQDGSSVSLKNRMRTDNHADQQITCRTAVDTGIAISLAGDGLTVVDPGRHLDRHLFRPTHAAHSAAGFAGLMNDLARPTAFGAGTHGLCHAEGGTLGRADLAAAAAVRTDLRCGPGGAAGAVAVGAGFDPRDVQLFLTAKSRFFKTDVQLRTHIVSAARGIWVPCLAAAAEAENVAETGEDIAEVSKTAAKSAETAAEARIGVKGCMTVLIVLLPLFLVGEDFIGLVGLFEAFFAGFVAGMQVRVVFLGDLAVCFFYFFCRGVLFDAEHFVIISFFCHAFLRSE